MGAIQNSFNQALGIASLVAGTAGKELGEQRAEAIALKNETEAWNNEVDKTMNRALEIQSKMDEYKNSSKKMVGMRAKAYNALMDEYNALDTQTREYAERLKGLNAREATAKNKFKYGVFGMKRAQKEIDTFNKDVDEIVGGKK